MALKLTGATSQQDPAWNFRFMLDSVTATNDYRKYKGKDFCSVDFDYSNRQEDHLIHIYSMMDDSYLVQCMNYYPKANRMAQDFFEKVLVQRTKKDMSPALFSALVDNLSTWTHPTIGFNIGEYVLKQPDALTHIENVYQKFSHYPEACALLDMITSYWLLNGNDTIRDRAQKAILAFNLGDSLAVLAYAQKAGLVQKTEDQNAVFTEHFRQGNVHKETIRLLKKNKDEVKAQLQATDPIFQDIYTFDYPDYRNHVLKIEAWALAINLMYQKDPVTAQQLFDKNATRWQKHLYTINNLQDIEHDRYAAWNQKASVEDLLPILAQAGPAFYHNEKIQDFLKNHLQWGIVPDVDVKVYTRWYAGLPQSFWRTLHVETLMTDEFVNTIGVSRSFNARAQETKKNWVEVVKWMMNHRYDLDFPLFKNPSYNILYEVLEKGSLLGVKEKKQWKKWCLENPNDIGAHLFPIPHDQVGPSSHEIDLLF